MDTATDVVNMLSSFHNPPSAETVHSLYYPECVKTVLQELKYKSQQSNWATQKP